MPETQYQTALSWGDISEKEWKILGQFFVPTDPNGVGCWVYFLPNATDAEMVRQRSTGNLLTSIARINGLLCLLARRPTKKHRSSDSPRGFSSKASWLA